MSVCKNVSSFGELIPRILSLDEIVSIGVDIDLTAPNGQGNHHASALPSEEEIGVLEGDCPMLGIL